MAELSDFEHERLLRLWLVAVTDRAEDDDAVWSARELLACNQHGHWSRNHLPLRGPRSANLSRRLGEGHMQFLHIKFQTVARHDINFSPLSEVGSDMD